MKRSRMQRGTRRVGQRAAERRAAGGPLVAGRSTTAAEWKALKRAVWLRGKGRCENAPCGAVMADPHHIVKRRPAGPNADRLENLAGLCRDCHSWTDEAPDGHRGKLKVSWDTAIGLPAFHVATGPTLPPLRALGVCGHGMYCARLACRAARQMG